MLPTLLSSVAGSWTSSGPAALPKACLESSRCRRSRSGTGSDMDLDAGRRSDGVTTQERDEPQPAPTRGPDPARGARDPKRERRPGSPRKPRPARRRVRIREGAPAEFAVATQCRALGISESGYYASVLSRAPSVRFRGRSAARPDPGVARRVARNLRGTSRTRTLSSRRGRRPRPGCPSNAVLRPLQGVSPRKWAVTTQQDRTVGAAPDLVERKFQANGPNKLWVADITYVPTLDGFLYLAVRC